MLRQMEEKIAYTYVTADILHLGHLLYLENAKSLVGLEGKLVVGVLTDEAVMEKKSKPIIPFNERMHLVKSLKCVDCAVAQDTYSPIKNVKIIKPDILIESSSHTEEALIEARKIMEVLGGKVFVFPYYPEQCSTKIKEKIKGDYNNERG